MRTLCRSALAGLVLVSGVACSFPAFGDSYQTSCVAALISAPGWVPATRWEGPADKPVQVADPGMVHSNRWPDNVNLADLGDFTAMHWQVTAPQTTGRHLPQPRDCGYQAVVQLRPEDARALGVLVAAAFQRDEKGRPIGATGAVVEPPYIWPALREFVPADTRWLHQAGYDDRLMANWQEGTRWRRLFLDVEHAVAVLDFADDTD